MFDWITGNYQGISALASFGMLVVWVVYLQLFVGSYRRQRRPKILINRGAGSGLSARCLISNMSAEAIYMQSIIAVLETSEGRWTCPITDLEDREERDSLSDLKLATRQGPLASGQVMDIGTFHSLVDHVLQHRLGWRDGVQSQILDKLVAFDVIVVAVYGPDDLLAGAKRRFDLVRKEDGVHLKVHSIGTDQIRSRRERKKIGDMLEEDL